MLLVLSLIACSNDYLVIDANTEDSGLSEEELELYDGAELVIDSPLSGDFIAIEDGGTLIARVVDAEGNELEFQDIQWATSVDDGWALEGPSHEGAELEIGTHALTATAVLPNGDRLAYTVGGVLVQSVYAGTYTGEMRVAVSAQGISTGCAGATTVVIDQTGEALYGLGSCFISIQGFDIDGAYVLEGDNDQGDMEGSVSVNLLGFDVPMDISGEVTEDGVLTGDFAGDVFGQAEFEGTLAMTRLSREVIELSEDEE
jgi:hypothetical protein